MSQCFTSPNYWGYNLQQISEGDVQNPKRDIYQPLNNLEDGLYLRIFTDDVLL